MGDVIHGAGANKIIPDDTIPDIISDNVMIHGYQCNVAPNIAKAAAEFEGELVCGNTIKWLVGKHSDESILQQVQGNEEPEATIINMCSETAEICGKNDIHIKVSVDQLRKLECADKRETYINYIEGLVQNTFEESWDNSHIAFLIQMAKKENTGNNALGLGINLGSPDNPIILSKTDRQMNADILEGVFSDLHLVLGEQQGECEEGDNALLMSSMVTSSALKVFSDLNTCCSEKNVRVTGNLPQTVLGFDPIKTTKKVMRVRYRGRILHYIVAAAKDASGFVSDTYNFKWWEGKRDWFLVGTEVHGSYVLKPEHVAVAVVAFE